jgi:hypothetical protein
MTHFLSYFISIASTIFLPGQVKLITGILLICHHVSRKTLLCGAKHLAFKHDAPSVTQRLASMSKETMRCPVTDFKPGHKTGYPD